MKLRCRFISKIPFNRKVIFCKAFHCNRKVSECSLCREQYLSILRSTHSDQQLGIDFNE